MRDIKFRAWDKEEKVMRLVKSIKFADDGFAETALVHLVGGKSYGYVNGENCELLMYTGLKDGSGKEIYEGDILAPDNTCRGSNRYIIEWNDKHCCFTSIEGGIDNFIGGIDEEIQFQLLSNMRLNICRIVGNIYDDSEGC